MGIWAELEMDIWIHRQFWTKWCRHIHKIKSHRFFYGMFYHGFFENLTHKCQNFPFRWATEQFSISSNHCRDFLEIFLFLKIPSLQSFGDSRGNSWSNLLVIIIYNANYNALELYDVLVQIQVTTNKTEIDIYHNKLGIRVA